MNPHHRTQEGITVAEEGFKMWYFGAKLHPPSASSHTEGRRQAEHALGRAVYLCCRATHRPHASGELCWI